jgi:hypothetical protein
MAHIPSPYTYGGMYLFPVTFIHDTYQNEDFRDEEFWKKEQANWGAIIHSFVHTSITPLTRGGVKFIVTCKSPIALSVDGLLGMEVPAVVHNREESIMVINQHLSTFIAQLNLGGIYFTPPSEKKISPIEYTGTAISQTGAGGDMYSTTTLYRAMMRYQIPRHPEMNTIDFDTIGLDIKKLSTMIDHHNKGRSIVTKIGLTSGEEVLFLEAMDNEIMSKWNNKLFLGWAFIEILVDRLWQKKMPGPKPSTIKRSIDQLRSNNIIDPSLYSSLDTLRDVRNNLIHGAQFVYRTDLQGLFPACYQLIDLM